MGKRLTLEPQTLGSGDVPLADNSSTPALTNERTLRAQCVAYSNRSTIALSFPLSISENILESVSLNSTSRQQKEAPTVALRGQVSMSQHADQPSRSISINEDQDAGPKKVSVIEKSVTHLLIATKSLLETLTKWSKQQASETEVSDVYVRLGYEFNIACRAFKGVGVETDDLGPVPDMLRGILEETLSGDASQQHLDKYLPQIRDIIVSLLQGLKRKQQRLRASVRQSERNGNTSAPTSLASQAARQSSTASITSSTASDDFGGRQASRYKDNKRQESIDTTSQAPERAFSHSSAVVQPMIPQRTSSGRAVQGPQSTAAGPLGNVVDGPFLSSSFARALSNSKRQPYPQEDQTPASIPQDTIQLSDPDVPRHQGRGGDALAKLQRGGELERRASRRFSAYQISKHLGSSSSGIPMMPPPQNSPVPNRGRDLRESMNAVRTRGSQMDRLGAAKNKYALDASPSRPQTRPERIVEEASTPSSNAPTFEMPPERSPDRSPLPETPAEKLGPAAYPVDPPIAPDDEDRAENSSKGVLARTDSPLQESFEAQAERAQSSQTVHRKPNRTYTSPTPEPASEPASDRSSQSKELTVFLQYKTRIKKFVLPDGYDELSIPRLQLAFIEKFAWNTHNNGIDLPEIYVQDPVSGVRHELEDLADVKNRSVLVLNVDAVDEVKRHMDDGMGGLKSLMHDIKTAITDQASVLKSVADKQQESSKDILKLANAPPQTTPSNQLSQTKSLPNKGVSTSQFAELQSLRRDLAVMRQTYTSFVSDMNNSISDVRSKADVVKDLASKPQATASADSTPSTSRAYVQSSRKTLATTSESIMTRVEELQDTVEDLRKDVVTRGVRPRARQLEEVSKEMASASRELKKLQEYVVREKPTWQKIWREELQTVYDEQNELTYQEDLNRDLEGDLEAAVETFKLVEEATKQQNLANGGSAGADGKHVNGGSGLISVSGTRIPSRTLNVSPAPDPRLAKETVLGEVKALQPNHETRLEAIERAERNRRRELEDRKGGEFSRELGSFVDEGRLKKSGGIEETERVRRVKEERTRRLVWERMNGIVSEEPSDMDSSQQHEADDTDTPNFDSADGLSAAMQDLSSLAGSGLPPDTAATDRETAAIAEAANVPQPLSLDVPDAVKENIRVPGEFRDSRATTPEPPVVEVNEWLQNGV